MQFEEFDDKAREAAKHHRPGYDESSWEKMELLLNKHLPQKKDDRRPLAFLILLFILLGSGAWLFIAKPWKSPGQFLAIEHETLQKTTQSIPGHSTQDPQNIHQGGFVNDELAENLVESKEYNTKLTPRDRTTKYSDDPKALSIANNVIVEEKLKVDEVSNNDQPTTKESEATKELPRLVSNEKTSNFVEPGNTPEKKELKNELKPAVPLIQEPNPLQAAGELAKVKTKSPRNSFSLSLTAGAGVSSSEGGSVGRIKPTLGGGISYTIKDRLSIRTGFYSGHKVYVSEPYEYHPPDIFWTYYPNLQEVDADCKVYEIPLSVAYHFGRSAKQSWFGSMGISSYLMKKETYKFLYKNSSGQMTTRTWTFNDKNKHFFSTLTLSGGYQRSLGPSVSVSVEPYLKVPLSGVGYGKVKLSSAGVLFSVDFRPFGKR